MAKPTPRRTLAHYGAPAAFLLAATILALLIHSAVGGGSTPGRTTTTVGPVTQPSTAKPATQKSRTATGANTSTTGGTVAGAQYTIVQTGDTFGAIATRNNTTVSQLEALNPGVSSNSLQVGQRIRIK